MSEKWVTRPRASVTMSMRRRMRCYRVALVAATLCSLVVGYSIPLASSSSRRILLKSSNDDYEEAPLSWTNRRGRIRPRRSAAISAQAEAQKAQAQERHEQALQDPTLLSNVKFSQRRDLHPSTKRSLLEIMGLSRMTEIQAETYAAAWAGKSVLASARTGTGKTLAFLLPTLERVLQGDRSLHVPGRHIGILIIAPTRELVIQIADEARLLLKFHTKDFTVMDMYGGTKMSRDTVQFNKRLPTILVATCGRLLDHIEQSRVGARKFSNILSETKIVVLDETDRLLDMGFQRDVSKILSFLPRPDKRQTLMFSATLPKRLRPAMQEVLGTNYVEIDCVGNDGTESAANVRVKQTYLLLESMSVYVVKLVEIILVAMHSADNDYKILVFFPATKLVRFFADVFNAIDMPVKELHSRMTQSARRRASSDFRESKRAILFTSDVSARGVDYPGVTHVIQYGSADSKVTYTHRIGRTGRAGRSGEGLLVLLPFEEKFVGSLRRNGVDESDLADADDTFEPHDLLVPVCNRIRSGNVKLKSSAEGAYRAFLAYYMSRLTPQELVWSANEFAESVGLTGPPSISERMAKRLNLVGIEGVTIDYDDKV